VDAISKQYAVRQDLFADFLWEGLRVRFQGLGFRHADCPGQTLRWRATVPLAAFAMSPSQAKSVNSASNQRYGTTLTEADRRLAWSQWSQQSH
jgi:hypothetical protein